MLLQLKQIKCYAFNRLKHNFGKAIGLAIVMVVTLAITIIIGQGAVWALNSTLIGQGGFAPPTVGTIVALFISLMVNLLVVSPLVLSVKKWYSTLRDCNPTFANALSVFGTVKSYFGAVWYCFVKSLIIFTISLCVFLPVLVISVVLKMSFSAKGVNFGVMGAFMMILVVAFLVLGLVYLIYLVLGCFYADYIYLSGKTHNPFKAVMLSFGLARHNRSKILLVYFSMIHMWVLYLAVIPIVFVEPYTKTTLAFFANEQVDTLQ